jgi:hypothetical protein
MDPRNPPSATSMTCQVRKNLQKLSFIITSHTHQDILHLIALAGRKIMM